MSIERLALDGQAPYRISEAAIHSARYLIARPFVRGKRVLDIACGEGFGARQMSDWGAASVVGVDIDAPAIEVANKLFAAPGVSFLAESAYDADKHFTKASFDVIVSLETIEHLDQPERYLKVLKALAAPGAVIIISCPNDHWYYPTEAQRNPFHHRKYRFDEFRKLTTAVLGTKVNWGFGGPVYGFGSVPGRIAESLKVTQGQASIAEAVAGDHVLFVPATDSSRLTVDTCSYFIGIWGGEIEPAAAVALTSMDEYVDVATIAGLKKAEVEAQRFAARITELEGVAAGYRNQIAAEEKRVAELEGVAAGYRRQIATDEARVAEIEGVAEGYRQRIMGLETAVGEKDSSLAALELAQSRSEVRLQAYLAQEEVTFQRFHHLNATVSAARAEVEANARRLREVEEALADYAARIRELEGLADTYRARILGLETEAGEKDASIAALGLAGARAEVRLKAYEAQEEATFQRFYELNGRLAAAGEHSGSLERRLSEVGAVVELYAGRIGELEGLADTYRARILGLETEAGEKDASIAALGLAGARAEVRLKAYEAQEETTFQRFYELNGRLAAAGERSGSLERRLSEVAAVVEQYAGRIGELEGLADTYRARILGLEAETGEKDARIANLALVQSRSEVRLKGYEAQEEFTFQRFFELNWKINDQKSRLEEREALIRHYEPIVQEYRRIAPILERLMWLWRRLPGPARTLVLGTGRALLRLRRMLRRSH